MQLFIFYFFFLFNRHDMLELDSLYKGLPKDSVEIRVLNEISSIYANFIVYGYV